MMSEPHVLPFRSSEDFDDRLQTSLRACSEFSPAPANSPAWPTELTRLQEQLHDARRALERNSRLQEIGRMAAHLAHEIRRNLLPMGLAARALRPAAGRTEQGQELLDQLTNGLNHLETTLEDLLHFVNQPEPQWEAVEVPRLVQEVLETVSTRMQRQAVQAILDVPRNVRLHADRALLRRALLDLVHNALDAMPEGGELTITAYVGRDQLELEVADSGPGLEREIRQTAFQPFYSTKGHGLGLGLTIVRQITHLHGGEVSVLNCPEGGAAFTLRLPLQAAARRMAA